MRLRWDAVGRLVGLEGPERESVELLFGTALRIADSRGRLVTFETDASGAVTAVERTGSSLQLALRRDHAGGLQGISSSRGWGLRVERADRRVTALHDDVLGDVRFEYDDHGLARAVVGPTAWAFARTSGRPDRITSSAGRDLRIGRDTSGRVSSISRGGRSPYTAVRDGAGRPTWIDPALGTQAVLRRDGLGRVRQVTLDREVLVELGRDGQGRVVRARSGDSQWELLYSLKAWPLRLISPSGDGLDVALDGAGRITTVSGSSGVLMDVEWSPLGRPVRLGSRGVRLDVEYSGSDLPAAIGPTRYRWTGAGVDVSSDAGPQRRIVLDRVGRIDAVETGDAVEDLAWGAGGALLAWERADDGSSPPCDIFGRVQAAYLGDGRLLELAYGVDGLLSRWRFGGPWQQVDRDARGKVRTPLGPSSTGGSTALLRGLQPRRSAVSRALLDTHLPPPWADRHLAGAASVVGPPVPRWAVDLQRDHAGLGWIAALPRPPASDLPVPDPVASDPLTVPGLLALLGFLPDDLAEHRVIVPMPPAPHVARCPGVAELRALHPIWGGRPFGAGSAVISAEPSGRGVVVLPDGVVVGHPVPWAPTSDPFALTQPSLEVLGAPTVSAAPAAVVTLSAPAVDRDPLVGPLQQALDLGRWIAPVDPPALRGWVGANEEPAGAIGIWLGSYLQAVVDHRGRLRGLDLGATAVGMWNRTVVDRTLAAFVGGGEIELPPLWLAAPGAAPEAGSGLAPGPGSVWPDRTGELRWVRPW